MQQPDEHYNSSCVTSLQPAAFSGCTSLTEVYFQSNAPIIAALGPFDDTAFNADNAATIYYLAGTTGWTNTYDGVPAVLWNPLIQTGNGNFGVRNNQFGFDITGTPAIPIVVEASTNLANPVLDPADERDPHQRPVPFQRTRAAQHPRPLLPHRVPLTQNPSPSAASAGQKIMKYANTIN